MHRMTARHWLAGLQAMAEAVEAQQAALSRLDSTVGDGDHGLNLARALARAAEQAAALDQPAPALIWRTAGTTLQRSMGGASGVLFGALFLGAAQALEGNPEAGLREVAEMLAAGLAEVQKRGKAQPGDKTMVDALAPAVQALRSAAAEARPLDSGLRRAAAAAREGAEATQTMLARHGRARFLGDRSVGYQDAGATSVAVMLEALAEALAGPQAKPQGEADDG